MAMIMNMDGTTKILIVGTSCTGKTTLGKKLSSLLQIPYYDLDDFHWLPNWVEKDDAIFIEDIKKEILPTKRWIVGGGYTTLVKDLLWTEVDIIIWLDFSLALILTRFLKRTFRRILFKGECCNGNYETIYNSFVAKDNLFFWILRHYHNRKLKFNDWRTNEFKDKHWVVLKSAKEEKSFASHYMESKK